MTRYAAFLRGINVGGRKAGGAQLRTAFEELGFDDVATFRASGNVVFDASRKVDAAAIERGLAKVLGFDVAVFLRTAREIEAIASHQPFNARRLKASKGKLQVAVLARKPASAARKRMLALQSDDDLFAFEGRELYWLPSGGLMDSAVGMKGITDVLGSNTVRTKGTIEQLAAKFFAG
ncbi:MAG TPA: DUF1697 domain-containing protein [Solirubrobacterales bacterium]|nr:DUF1697 domain-containing protein [Solirubrobacterales bacterium]